MTNKAPMTNDQRRCLSWSLGTCSFVGHWHLVIGHSHLAYSTLRTSRSTVTLISPGYCKSASIFLEMSRARAWHWRGSSIMRASTMTRTLSSGLDRVGLAHALEVHREVFQVLETFHVPFERFASSARTRGADRVGGHHDRRVRRGRRDVAMVRQRRVQHGFGLVEALEELHADLRVPAFGFVVHRLADVVQQTGAARQKSRPIPTRPRSPG